MAPNKSVERFRRLTVDLQRQVFDDAVAELNAQADALLMVMRTVVVHGPTSNLANSIRKELTSKETVVLVKAGGPTTTVQGSTGKPAYDYARAVEYGTEKIPAQSFFFPTYRLMKKKMRGAMSRKITKTIKKYSAE